MSERRDQPGAKCRRAWLWVALRQVAIPAVAVLLVSSCYVSTDYGRYPEGKLVQSGSLVRNWTGEAAELALKEDKGFSATGLNLKYFSCPLDGLRMKSGDGTWSSIDDGDSTSVLLRFEDGCTATMWTGESGGKTVLWATQEDENQVLTLQ
ncbi:hypothetical protein ACFWFF_05485 [Streptomyces sp. NPDC060223]|uniref:hypothetical protein n=1 Tax=unclassified Streptomyces TaxID=2593676 RepID=UPI003629F467